MILNLGAELITLSTPTSYDAFPFHSVEEHLTAKLINLYQQDPFDSLYVINGPWSFTNLRVGSLIATMLHSLSKESVKLFVSSKRDLFRYLYLQGILPANWYMYLGQRKKFWLVDLEKETKHLMVTKIFSDEQQEIAEDMFVDRFIGSDFPIFAKRTQDITLRYQDNKVIAWYQKNTLECSSIFEEVSRIEPVYGVELEFTKQPQ